jgi:CheY-like chemotaxis protein
MRSPATTPGMAPGTLVLVVDDDEGIREVLTQCLALEGYTTRSAGDGLEGLARLTEAPRPALVLLDLMMPRLDGVGFLARSAESGWPAGTRVVLMTAKGVVPPQVSGDARVAEVLKKPLDLEGLLGVLSRWCPPPLQP